MDFHPTYPERYRPSFAPDKFMTRRLKVQGDLTKASNMVRLMTNAVYDGRGELRPDYGDELAKWSKRLHRARAAQQREEAWVRQQLFADLIRLDPLVLHIVCSDLPRALAIARLMTLNAQHAVEQLMQDGIATKQEVAHAVAGARFCQRIWFAMSDASVRARLVKRLGWRETK